MLKNIDIKHGLKLIAIGLCVGILFFGFIFYFVATGEAFTYFRNWCMRSQTLSSVVGTIQKVELVPFGSFYVKDKGRTGSAGFTASIVGSTQTIKAKVTMTRQGTTWEVDQLLISGKALDVNLSP